MDRNFDVSLNCKGGATVALRKESVDRNNRRPGTVNNAKIVALRKESVDRNNDTSYKKNQPGSRSPQGERG